MTRALPLFSSLALLAAAACQPGEQPGSEYMPDMARGPAYKAFAPNLATRSGITLQRPVAGTIARGYQPFHYGKGESEALRASVELTNPLHPTPETLAKGKALYQIYCQVCHGAEGKGDGPIANKIPPPPSYKSDRLLGFTPGRIFHVITMGANKMPSYAVQLAPDERWQVITYVRTQLQGLPEAAPGLAPTPPAPEVPAPGAGGASTTPAAPTPPAASAPPATPTAPRHAPGGGQ